MEYIERNITKELLKSLETRPLTYLNGGKQVGKSTLCFHLSQEIKVNHITFDSPLLLNSAKTNPGAFVDGLSDSMLNIIDEVQFAPEIFPYLKMTIDNNRLNGNTTQKFLLTGSANLLALPKLSEALVGRMSVLTLYSFSTSEVCGSNDSLIDKIFNQDFKIARYDDFDIVDIIKKSTYPEIAMDVSIDRIKWFDSYLTTILNRDVKSISDLKKPNMMVSLLSILALRTGGLLNNMGIANEIGIDYRTYEKMFSFALNSFTLFNIKPWAKPNKLNKRYVKSPKLYYVDCNFLLYILKRDLNEIYDTDKQTFGHIFKNFVASELYKTVGFENVELSHFRTQSGNEVDFVLENMQGEIVGIEVKSSKFIDKKCLSSLKELKSVCGEQFKKGIVLYSGCEVFPLTEDI